MPLWTAIRQFITSQWAVVWHFVLQILGRNAIPPPQARGSLTPRSPPSRIIYRPIPGSWRRKERPDLPDSIFRIPDNVPYGTICYITRGKRVGRGDTAHIELLPSGHIVKYPKLNPFYPQEEEGHRRKMNREAEVYQQIGYSRYIPKLIEWDPDSCCLTLEYLENGDLGMYIKDKAEIPDKIRRRWVSQAANGVAVLHKAGVVHSDIAPRNFMLNAVLDLHIADFAGSLAVGSTPNTSPGPRFEPPDWSWDRKLEMADDIFALGSIIYFIMVGKEPYADLSEDKVVSRFKERIFPSVGHLPYGGIIQDCWDGSLDTADKVVAAIDNENREESPFYLR